MLPARQVAKLGGVEAVQADTLKQLVTLKRERDELAVQLAQADGEVDLLKIELFEMSKHFQGSKGTIGYRGRVHDVQYLANLQARRMSPRKVCCHRYISLVGLKPGVLLICEGVVYVVQRILWIYLDTQPHARSGRYENAQRVPQSSTLCLQKRVPVPMP